MSEGNISELIKTTGMVVIAFMTIYLNHRFNKLHTQINSNMEKFMAVEKDLATAKGVATGRAEKTAEIALKKEKET